MADLPDVTKMPTSGPAVNAPDSGTYGEGAALDRLKAALPATPPGAGPTADRPAMPMPQPGAGSLPGAPSGVPAGILSPSSRPDVPMHQAPQAAPVNPMAGAVDTRQKNLLLLDSLVQDPTVSETTREWAQNLIQHIVSTTKR